MSDALKQAEALRIAQELPFVQMGTADWTLCDEAAAELRRQHAEIERMRAAIKACCKENYWAADSWKRQSFVAALFEIAAMENTK